jgi:hypothetical protein
VENPHRTTSGDSLRGRNVGGFWHGGEAQGARDAYAADLPTPDEVIRSIGEGGSATANAQAGAFRTW